MIFHSDKMEVLSGISVNPLLVDPSPSKKNAKIKRRGPANKHNRIKPNPVFNVSDIKAHDKSSTDSLLQKRFPKTFQKRPCVVLNRIRADQNSSRNALTLLKTHLKETKAGTGNKTNNEIIELDESDAKDDNVDKNNIKDQTINVDENSIHITKTISNKLTDEDVTKLKITLKGILPNKLSVTSGDEYFSERQVVHSTDIENTCEFNNEGTQSGKLETSNIEKGDKLIHTTLSADLLINCLDNHDINKSSQNKMNESSVYVFDDLPVLSEITRGNRERSPNERCPPVLSPEETMPSIDDIQNMDARTIMDELDAQTTKTDDEGDNPIAEQLKSSQSVVIEPGSSSDDSNIITQDSTNENMSNSNQEKECDSLLNASEKNIPVTLSNGLGIDSLKKGVNLHTETVRIKKERYESERKHLRHHDGYDSDATVIYDEEEERRLKTIGPCFTSHKIKQTRELLRKRSKSINDDTDQRTEAKTPETMECLNSLYPYRGDNVEKSEDRCSSINDDVSDNEENRLLIDEPSEAIQSCDRPKLILKIGENIKHFNSKDRNNKRNGHKTKKSSPGIQLQSSKWDEALTSCDAVILTDLTISRTSPSKSLKSKTSKHHKREKGERRKRPDSSDKVMKNINKIFPKPRRKRKDEDDLPKILPPKRRRQKKETGDNDVKREMERFQQEFPRYNWLEKKYLDGQKQDEMPPPVSNNMISLTKKDVTPKPQTPISNQPRISAPNDESELQGKDPHPPTDNPESQTESTLVTPQLDSGHTTDIGESTDVLNLQESGDTSKDSPCNQYGENTSQDDGKSLETNDDGCAPEVTDDNVHSDDTSAPEVTEYNVQSHITETNMLDSTHDKENSNTDSDFRSDVTLSNTVPSVAINETTIVTDDKISELTLKETSAMEKRIDEENKESNCSNIIQNKHQVENESCQKQQKPSLSRDSYNEVNANCDIRNNIPQVSVSLCLNNETHTNEAKSPGTAVPTIDDTAPTYQSPNNTQSNSGETRPSHTVQSAPLVHQTMVANATNPRNETPSNQSNSFRSNPRTVPPLVESASTLKQNRGLFKTAHLLGPEVDATYNEIKSLKRKIEILTKETAKFNALLEKKEEQLRNLLLSSPLAPSKSDVQTKQPQFVMSKEQQVNKPDNHASVMAQNSIHIPTSKEIIREPPPAHSGNKKENTKEILRTLEANPVLMPASMRPTSGFLPRKRPLSPPNSFFVNPVQTPVAPAHSQKPFENQLKSLPKPERSKSQENDNSLAKHVTTSRALSAPLQNDFSPMNLQRMSNSDTQHRMQALKTHTVVSTHESRAEHEKRVPLPGNNLANNSKRSFERSNSANETMTSLVSPNVQSNAPQNLSSQEYEHQIKKQRIMEAQQQQAFAKRVEMIAQGRTNAVNKNHSESHTIPVSAHRQIIQTNNSIVNEHEKRGLTESAIQQELNEAVKRRQKLEQPKSDQDYQQFKIAKPGVINLRQARPNVDDMQSSAHLSRIPNMHPSLPMPDTRAINNPPKPGQAQAAYSDQSLNALRKYSPHSNYVPDSVHNFQNLPPKVRLIGAATVPYNLNSQLETVKHSNPGYTIHHNVAAPHRIDPPKHRPAVVPVMSSANFAQQKTLNEAAMYSQQGRVPGQVLEPHPVQPMLQRQPILPGSSPAVPQTNERLNQGQPCSSATAHTAATTSVQQNTNPNICHSSPQQGKTQSNAMDTGTKAHHIFGSCILCNKFSLYLCSTCQNVWYCSQQCQLKHWTTHQHECKHTAVG